MIQYYENISFSNTHMVGKNMKNKVHRVVSSLALSSLLLGMMPVSLLPVQAAVASDSFKITQNVSILSSLSRQNPYYVANEAYQRISEFNGIYGDTDRTDFSCGLTDNYLTFSGLNTPGLKSSYGWNGVGWNVNGTKDSEYGVAQITKLSDSSVRPVKAMISDGTMLLPLSELDANGGWQVHFSPRYKKGSGSNNFIQDYILPEYQYFCNVEKSAPAAATTSSLPAPTGVSTSVVNNKLRILVKGDQSQGFNAVQLGFHKGTSIQDLFLSKTMTNGETTIDIPLDTLLYANDLSTQIPGATGTRINGNAGGALRINSGESYQLYVALGKTASASALNEKSLFNVSNITVGTSSTTNTTTNSDTFQVLNRYQQGEGTRIEFQVPDSWGENYSIRLFFDGSDTSSSTDKAAMKAVNGVIDRASGIGQNAKAVFINVPKGKEFVMRAIAVRPKSGKSWSSTSFDDYEDISSWINTIFVYNNGATQATTAPLASKNITLTAESSGFVVKWDPAVNAEFYKVELYEKTTSGNKIIKTFDQLSANAPQNVVFPTTLGLTQGVQYFAAVRPSNAAGVGPYAATGWTTFGVNTQISGTVGGTTSSTVTALSTPSTPQVDIEKGLVSWSAVANAEKYVYSLDSAAQCPEGQACNWKKIYAGNVETPSVQFQGLLPNSSYRLTVKARTVVTKNGTTETIDSPNVVKIFTTAKLAESWVEGAQSSPEITQANGVDAKIENGKVVVRYDFMKSPFKAKANKLVFQIMTEAADYDLMTKNITSNDQPQGRIEIPLGNIQGVPQIATILNSNGNAKVWFRFKPYDGQTLLGGGTSMKMSDTVYIPEAGQVQVSGGFATQSANGGSNTPAVSIDAVSSLAAVYNKDKSEINVTWGSVSNAAGYVMEVTGKGLDGKSFSAKQYVTTNAAKVAFPLAGTTYTVKVLAVHSSGVNSSSKETTVTIPEWKPYLTAQDVEKLTQTTNASGSNVTATATLEGTNEQVSIPGVTINWEAISDPIFSNYRVYIRKKESNPVAWEYAANYDAAKKLTYRIVGLLPDTIYEYKIAAQYNVLEPDGSLKTVYKDISPVKELPKTPATQTQPESMNLPEAYERADDNERRIMNNMSDGIRLLKAHIVYKDANGAMQVMPNVYSANSGSTVLRDVPTYTQKKEWYAKITPTNVPGTIEGVILTTQNNGPVEDGSKGALWALDRKSKAELGTCIFNVSPYCDAAVLSGGRKGIFIPKESLREIVQVEVLSLPTGNLSTYYKDGKQVTDVGFDNKFMGYPLALDISVPVTGSADYPQASLYSVEGGQNNKALFPGMTTVREVQLQALFSKNTAKCEVQENGGAWEEIQCIKDGQAHLIPYTLKTTQSGEVALLVRATNTLGQSTSEQRKVRYSTTVPNVTLTGVPTGWQTAGVQGIEAKCAANDGSCTQVAIVATNLLTPNQECSDLQTIAPTLPFTAVCSQDNNFCRNLTFAALPGPNPTYMCAKTQNEFGVVNFAPKQELKSDSISPEANFELMGLLQSGANYYTNTSTVTLKMNDLLAGPSNISSCTIGGDITGTVACPEKGQSRAITLTSGNAIKRITVTVKNGAGVENVFAKYLLQDSAQPTFSETSNIVAYDRMSSGKVKIKPALVTDANLDRIELTLSSNQSGFVLPANLFSSIYAGVSVEGNKIIIRANEDGQIDNELITTGLLLENLPAQANGQYVNYTIVQKGFDKAGNSTVTDKQLSFTLQEEVATETITVTGGTVSFPSTSDSKQIPLNITFSGGPVYYTMTKNGVEGAKILYNGYVVLDGGDYSGLAVTFYNAQNQQIGEKYTNLSIKVNLSKAVATTDVADVTRTKNPTFTMKLLSIASEADKVNYKVLRGGTELLSGERQKSQFTQALSFENLQLVPNTSNEFYIVLTDSAGKETLLKRTVIHDTEAPKTSAIQATILENTKPKWTFVVTDAADTPISSVKARLTNLTTGEQKTLSNLTVASSGQYEVTYGDLTMRPGHEYVLDIITEDALGNTMETRTVTPLTKVKTQTDKIDMLQKSVNIDNTIVNTDLMKVTLANEKVTYVAEQMSRGKQVVFGDVLSKGKTTTNQALSRLPVGVYQMKIDTVGAGALKTQTVSTFVVDPYFSDASGDLNGDGVVGLTDEVLFTYGKAEGKYPTSDTAISALVQSIQAKLDAAKQANISQYIKG